VEESIHYNVCKYPLCKNILLLNKNCFAGNGINSGGSDIDAFIDTVVDVVPFKLLYFRFAQEEPKAIHQVIP